MATKTKKAVASPRGNTYVLTATGTSKLADVSGQGAIIRDVLKKGAITAAGILAKAGKALKSDTPAKNIAFYLCIWRSKGFVKFGPKAKA